MAFIRTDNFVVRGYECDALGRMSIPALMNLMQESANRNAVDYGIGIAHLAQEGLGWMLMRFQLKIYQYPRYGQQIRVVTYPTLVEKYFIYRDFRVLAEDETLLADAVSTWLVFATDSRTMIPLPNFIRNLTPPDQIEPLAKLPLKPDFQNYSFENADEKRVEVGWFSIDQNQHVNNVAYVQWLLEAVDDQRLNKWELTEIDLVYRTETHWHDQLRIRSVVETQESMLHQIRLDENGKDVLLARSRWRTNQDKLF